MRGERSTKAHRSWDSGTAVWPEHGVCLWARAGTVAFGAREGSRAWVMEAFVYRAKKLGFYLKAKGLY